MTFKKVSVITIAGAALLAGAIGIAMSLTSPSEVEIEVPETPAEQGTEPVEDGSKTLENMENIPIYFDDTDTLLLPLRNVMEGLGGSVTWEAETRTAAISYRSKKLEVTAGERDALLNGYEVTLPDTVKMINGCLYADEKLISAYYTGEVAFNSETRQVTLQEKDSTVPVVAVKEIAADQEDRGYSIDVPVIVGLNDSNFEKNLNETILQEMQAYADAFLETESENDNLLKLEMKIGFCTKDFLSIWWEGTRDGKPVKLTKNIDLLGQKTVTLEDMLDKTSLEEVKVAAGEGWTPENFFLTAEGGLVLLEGDSDGILKMHYWTTEGKQPNWKGTYKALFQK